MSSVFLYNYLQRTRSERNGLELKTRLLNFVGTKMTEFLINLFLFAWLSMTIIKPLHVEFCLETRDKKHHILAALPIHRCPLSFSIIIMNGPERNRTEKQIDIYGKSLLFMSRDLLFHFVEGPRGKGWTVLNSQRLWNRSQRYWNGLGMFQEQKKRLLKLLETYMNDYLLNDCQWQTWSHCM